MKRFVVVLLCALTAAVVSAVEFVDKNVTTRDFSPELAKKLRIRQAWTTNDTHGDIYIITTPDKKVTLVDCGWGDRANSTKKYYEIVLFPALAEQNIRHIDRIIITHPHGDHIGGLPHLLRKKSISVGEVCWSYLEPEMLKKTGPSSIKYQNDVITLCRQRNIPVRDVKDGEIIPLGKGVTATVLTTGFRKAGRSNWLNNQSIVFQLKYGTLTMLFTGDCGFEEEKYLLKKCPAATLKSDVLKLGHHGGAGSTGEKFLQTVAPTAAIAPIPDWLAADKRGQRVVKLMQSKKIPYFMSWQYPQLSVVTDGKTFEMINIVYPKQK